MISSKQNDLHDYVILYFGNDWAAENRTSSHHIAARLMAQHDVVYVDSPGMRAPVASGRDFKKIINKLRQLLSRPEPITGSAWRITIPQIPFRRLPMIDLINTWVSTWAVGRALKLSGFSHKKIILWFAVPHPGYLVGKLKESYVVYYCIDDYAAHPGVDPIKIKALDDALTKSASRVFVAPPALVQAKLAMNATTLYSPHGVDAQMFGLASDPQTVVPSELADIKGPIIGYFGSVAPWIDIDLLAYVAAQNPDCTMVLIGHVATDVQALTNLPNVRMMGPKKYADLPKWAKAFSVVLIPYLKNQQVLNANPLKLREYLATGKPIVSVSNPEIAKFADVVAIADDKETFSKLVRKAIESDDADGPQKRMAAVKDSTWDARVRDTLKIVNDDLAKL
jgi:glycosyltransferase involved in cell wall biosynthesis